MKKFVVLLFYILCGCFAQISLAQSSIDNPQIKWRFTTDGAIRGDAVVDGDHLFFGNSDGDLYAVRKSDGHRLWKKKVRGALVNSPAVSGNLVVVSSRDKVYGIHRITGRTKWKFRMRRELDAAKSGWKYFTASPVIANGKVYVGSGDGHLYALDRATGYLHWKFRTNSHVRATPLVVGGTVYQPSNDGFVYVIDAESGRLKWKFETEGVQYNPDDYNFDRKSIYATPILVDDTLIIGSRDGNVYAVDIDTQEAKWKFTYGPTWAMSTAVDDDTVYVGWSTNDLFSAIDLHTGEEKWKFTAGSHNYTKALISDYYVYFGSADGKLYQLDKFSGERVWEYDIGREIYSSPIYDAETEAVFLGSDDGNLYAIEQGLPTYKAVYQPTEFNDISYYLIVDWAITPYLVEKGYQQLESQEQLQQFVETRIADGAPSVIVFSLPSIPDALMGENPKSGLMRQYLETGGKVVWFGDPPNYYQLNEAGNNFSRSAEAGSRLLDVRFTDVTESGNYHSDTTQQGLNWGLPEWLKTTATPVHPRDVTPLAFDEFRRVSAWLKQFNPRPGSGYVSLRTWAWNVPIRDEDLELIEEVASYGLD